VSVDVDLVGDGDELRTPRSHNLETRKTVAVAVADKVHAYD